MDKYIEVELGAMGVSVNGNSAPRVSELEAALLRFKKKLPVAGELGQPTIGEDEGPKSFYKRFGRICPERVAFTIQDVSISQPPEGKTVVFKAKINPEGPMADSLNAVSPESPPTFAMRAFRDRSVSSKSAENKYEIITWDLINPPQK